MPRDDAWADVEAIIARGGSIKAVSPREKSEKLAAPRNTDRTCRKRRSGVVCGRKLSRFNRANFCFSCQGESPW